ncbi:MAG: protein kinase, partial [Phycisphaerales bacterium]|nr:protein kinase [Phycisphaerales bacterium]
RMLDEDAAAEADGFLAEPLLDGRFLIGRSPSADRAPLPSIRGYSVVALIGSGSSGLVYRAEAAEPLSRTVAVKVLREGLPVSVRAKFTREQQALARLNHPGVAQVYDAGETDDGRLYVAVEFVDGNWITRYAEEHSLDWRSRIELMAQICEAVHAIHTTGVMHRDLKPANILVTEVAGVAKPKVIDFGASALVQPSQANLTEGPRLLGTVAYMAPEQLTRGERGDARVDVFALGVVAHELIAGRHPYGAPDAPLAELVRDLTEKALPELTKSLGADRRTLEAVLAKATAKATADRYASAQHLADDLRRVLARLPVDASTRSALGEVRSLCRRYPMTTLGGVAALIAIVVLAFAFAHSADQSRARANEMTATVDTLTDHVLAEINELSGANEAKERLASLLLERLDAIPEVGRGPRIDFQRAEALQSLASVAFDRADAATALDLRRQAHDALERALSADPDSRSVQDALLRATILIGDAEQKLGRLDEALGHYQTVHDTLKEQLASSPDDARLLDELTWSYERLTTFVFARSPETAMPLYNERLALAERLYERRPDDVMAKFALGSAFAELASVTRRLGDPAGGERHAREACMLLGETTAKDPHRLAFRFRELTANLELSRSLLELDSPDAVRAMQHTLTLAQAISEENPESEPAWRYRCTILEQAVVLFDHFGELALCASVKDELARHYESPLSDHPASDEDLPSEAEIPRTP